jgi:hypothetical protein
MEALFILLKDKRNHMKDVWIVGCILCTLLLIPVAVSADGNITITSNPAGATIILDSVTQSNVTPTTLHNVVNGSHNILLQLTNYMDAWANITVSGDQTVTASLSLNVTTTATTATPTPTPTTNVTATPTSNVTTATTTAPPVINGSIAFSSSPSNANVYIDSVLKGYTPITVYNITPDSYAVRIQKPGYLIYSNRVNVTSGNTTTVSATLTVEPTATPTLSATAAPTTVTTVTPKKTSTAKTYTPWPTSTPTEKSPAPLAICIGALGVGFVVLRKR